MRDEHTFLGNESNINAKSQILGCCLVDFRSERAVTLNVLFSFQILEPISRLLLDPSMIE